jgi:hypothetical protein
MQLMRSGRRVLKPDGSFILLEHGLAPHTHVVAWQNRLTPMWKRFTVGCHLNRKIDELIAGVGFEISELKACYLPGPRPMAFTYEGLAIRQQRPTTGSKSNDLSFTQHTDYLSRNLPSASSQVIGPSVHKQALRTAD